MKAKRQRKAADVTLVSVPANVFEAYRSLAAATEAFVDDPAIRTSLSESYSVDGVPRLTLYGDVRAAFALLYGAYDVADRVLGRTKEPPR